MRPYVTKVEAALKGAVVAQPGRKTIIVGPNGAGKSAIVNAIEAAGSGRVSDVAGRATLAKDADLFLLAPPGADRTWSTLHFNVTGIDAGWSLEKGHRAKRTGVEIAFPLREAREAILGSPETARRWVLQHGEGFSWDEIVALVPESLRKRLGTVAAGTVTAAAALGEALERARRAVREANAAAKAQRTVTAPPRPPPTDAEIAAMEAIIATWRGQSARATAIAKLDRVRAALAQARANVETLAARAGGYERELGALPPAAGGEEVRQAAVLVIEALAKGGATACAICGGKTDPKALGERAARGRARIAEAAAVEKRRGDLGFALREAMADLARARQDAARLEAEEAEAGADAGKNETTLPEIDLGTAEIRLRELHAVRAGWDTARRAEERALQAERDAMEWGQLDDALTKALAAMVEKSRAAFVAKVQKYLPRDMLFGLDLVDEGREVLRVGLLRPSGDRMVLHAALSGAEWAAVTAALAIATAPAEGPCIVCPEERAFDPETLAKVLRGIDDGLAPLGEDAPQFILASPVAPTSLPAEWTVIEVGKDGASEKTTAKQRRNRTRALFKPVTLESGEKTLVEVPVEEESDLFS